MIDLEEDEQILLEIGPHIYFLVWPLFWSLFFSFLILGFALAKAGFSFWFFVSFLISASIFWTYAILSYARFYKNKILLTNKRLWSRKQIKPFKIEIREIRLEDILEISCRIEGIKAMLLDFGDLIIKTHSGKLVIERVAKPEKLKKQIIDLKDYWLKQSHTL